MLFVIIHKICCKSFEDKMASATGIIFVLHIFIVLISNLHQTANLTGKSTSIKTVEPTWQPVSCKELKISRPYGLVTIHNLLDHSMHTLHCKQRSEATVNMNLYLTILSLMAAGDVNPNPGPSVTDPCGLCGKSVRRNQPGLRCTHGCNLWYHADWVNVNKLSPHIIFS